MTELDRLRARIRAIEGGGTELVREVTSLGLDRIDRALPWGGLPRRSVHEIGGLAAWGCAALFAGRIAATGGHVVWVHHGRIQGRLHGPGMPRFGLDPSRVILAFAKDDAEAAWAIEEALRCPAVVCAVGTLQRFDLVLSRRLQLAAEAGGGTGLVLRTGAVDLAANAALGRWRVEPVASPGPRLWRLDLWRCRGGAAAGWTVGFVDRIGLVEVDDGSAAVQRA